MQIRFCGDFEKVKKIREQFIAHCTDKDGYVNPHVAFGEASPTDDCGNGVFYFACPDEYI